MKIKKMLSEYRNDFSAIMECEYCNHEVLNNSGYHDNNYHTKVISAMHCPQCGKNRAVEVKEKTS